MNEIRLGIIGLGGMGRGHAANVQSGEIPRCRLVAVADANERSLEDYSDLACFKTGSELIDSGLIDAVLIATPHFSHTELGALALRAGLHVMVEKPISVHKADCERLISAHRSKKLVFAGMFNLRADPFYIKLKGLIQSGELGLLRRINWIVTNYFRTAFYYRSGGWRATWAGEGGGVLMNQCQHQLDLWQWLFGMPDEVRAFCGIGRYHDIEVEDDVTAYLSYAAGTTGVFIASTGEFPGTNRLEVTGELGKIVIEDDRFRFVRNGVEMTSFSRAATENFTTPEIWNVDIPVSRNGCQRVAIMRNFTAAILDKAPLIAPASEGINSVELANSMIFSHFNHETIKLPIDARKYQHFLEERIASSRA